MMQRTSSAPPRGPRGASPSIRGSRGGIQKRKAGGVTRVDKDGDLVMDAAGDKRKPGRGRPESSAASRPSGRGSPARGGSLATTKGQQAILRGLGGTQANVLESRITTGGTTIRIDGLSSSKAASNDDGGLSSLLAFLERKASGLDAKSNRVVKIKKSHMKGDSVIITASPEDIERIQKLNGFTFAGAPLVIQACDPPPQKNAKSEGDKKSDVSPSTVETKERFRTILAGRYDSNLKLLNLSALAMDPGLKEMGVFDGSTTTSKIFPALMVVCDGLFKTRKEKAEAIVSVTLADNGLDSVSDVNSLAQTFPDIKNLDLSRNKFTGLKSLDPWRHKFRYLENLLLHGNPMEANLPIDKDELLDRYPNLQSINGHQVRSPGEIAAAHAAAEAAKSPIPIATPNFRDVGQVGEKFTKQYLTLYDNDRNALLANFYDHETSFSLAINMTAPRDRKNSAPIPPWAPYTQYSRNLTKVTHLPTRINRRFRGVQAIQPVWNNLPRTRHPSLQTEAYKYIIECEPLPGLPDPSGQSARGVDGLLLIIHGEYEEPNPSSPTEKALRSFTRTFALGPGRSGGQPIRVISDTLTLRAWGPLAQPTTGPSIQQTINNPEQMQQEAVTRQLVERTGMTPDYAILCLTETRWDLEKAFFAFERNRHQLPAEAFIVR